MSAWVRAILSAATIALAAAAIAIADRSIPTSPSAQPERSRGALVVDSLNGGRIVSARDMAPGECAEGTVKIRSLSRAKLQMWASGVTDGEPLASHLRLRLFRQGQARRQPRVAWKGVLSDFGRKRVKKYNPKASRGYRYQVCLSDSTPNSLQGAATVSEFNWTARKTRPRR